MAVIAKLNYLRIAPRKVRLVTDLIRGKRTEEAQNILNFTIKKAAAPLLKLLKSAIANAKNNFQLNESNLYISKIFVDEGPKLKRWRARARGRADEIQKKTSHVTIVLDEIEKLTKKVKKGKKAKKAKEVEKVPPEGPRPRVEDEAYGAGKIEKPKLRPELDVKKPRIERGIKRIFRRKAF